MIIIEPGNPQVPDVARLFQDSHATMEALFPSDNSHYLTLDQLAAPHVHFFVARIRKRVVGTGALVEHDGYGEIKAMFVSEEARGQGVADAMLRQLEDEARRLNLTVLRLETGNKLNSALRLYGRHGFEICERFATYPDDGSSLFMEKTLS